MTVYEELLAYDLLLLELAEKGLLNLKLDGKKNLEDYIKAVEYLEGRIKYSKNSVEREKNA